jgi:hypothetical protein
MGKIIREETKRGFKGIWIPAEIWESPLLTLQEKVFLVEIDSLDKSKGCFASNSYFATFFNVSKSRCTQVIKSLEDKKLLTIKLKRKGKQIIRRTLKVSGGVVNILNRGSKYPKEGSKYPKGILLRNSNNTFNKPKKDISPTQTKPTLLERNKQYLPLVKKLAKIIKKKKDITYTSEQLKSWANDFRQLEENNKVSLPRMKAVLKWYKKNIGGQYIPVIESGSSFRSKFTKLEDAIIRQERPIKTNNTPAPRNGYTSQEEMNDLKAYEKANTETL